MEVKKIMLIDDESITNMLHRKTLNLYAPACDVQSYMNAGKALDDIEGYNPDIIFLDLQMPFMDGWQFLEAMKEKQISVPVVILTSSTSTHDREKSRAYSNVVHYLEKPLNKQQIGIALGIS